MQGLRRAFGEKNVQFDPDADPTPGFKADVVVLVVGENPYAEMKGDSATLELDGYDQWVFEQYTQDSTLSGVPLVTLVVSGRPLVMTAVLDRSVAVAELWLPGSEAGSVAEVLAGMVKPTAKLPHAWPSNAEQTKSVWPRGFGLTY